MTDPYAGWSGKDDGWRFYAQRMNGTGTPGAWLDTELPLHDVSITEVLSGPPQLTATISPARARLKTTDGRPLFDKWGTVIHAEKDGAIRGSYLLEGSGFDGPDWAIDAPGFTRYAKDKPFSGEASYSHTDPLTIVRHIWADVQTQQVSNLGLVVDSATTTPVRVGASPPAAGVAGVSNTSTDEKPYELNYWSTHDVGGRIDDLAATTPFDYRERHQWNRARTAVEHYLDFGYPTLGRRRNDLTFTYGVNIHTTPSISDGSGFANHVIVFGAGEGSAMVVGEAAAVDGRLRVTATVVDKKITDRAQAMRRARRELALRTASVRISDVLIEDTGAAPFGSFTVGDEIRVQTKTEWHTVDQWSRVIKLTITPDDRATTAAQIMRTDWVV